MADDLPEGLAPMDLRDYLRVIRAHWLGIIVITVLVVGAAAAYTYQLPKVYEASSTGIVAVGAGAAQDATTASINDSLARSRTASYVPIANSNRVADRAKTLLGSDADPGALAGSVTVTSPENTPLLNFTARASTAKGAKDLADAWVQATADEVATLEAPDGKARGGAVNVTPIEAAVAPGSPVSPQPRVNLAVGLLIGLLLGLAYALVRYQLDRRLRTSSDVEREFGTSVVGSIPKSDDLRSDQAPQTVNEVEQHTDWGASESFRKLRTNIAFMDVDNPPRVIVVTSPMPGEGKSTVAANLARAVALAGQEVTLIDGDLRRPTVATTFNLVEGAGLTDLLVGSVAISDVVQSHPDHPGLRVLTAGRIPPNPSELLGSRAMQTLLTDLSATGIVIVDAPPLLPVTDAAVLTRHADGALVVLAHGSTLSNQLSSALSSLESVQGRVLGLVFNRVPRKDTDSGYYGSYYGSDYSSRSRGLRRFGRSKGRRSSGGPGGPGASSVTPPSSRHRAASAPAPADG